MADEKPPATASYARVQGAQLETNNAESRHAKASERLPTNQPTNLITYLPTNLPTYQPTNLPAYLPTYLPTYL